MALTVKGPSSETGPRRKDTNKTNINIKTSAFNFSDPHKAGISMASAPTPSSRRGFAPGFNLSEQWLLTGATVLVGGILGYVVYDAVMATASELLQRLLVISPLLLVISVHWLSAGGQFGLPVPGSEPGAIHRAGGSAWGVVLVLMLLFFLISYQPSFNGLLF